MDDGRYRTEMEARLDFVVECLRLTGIREGSAEHAALMDFYNLIAKDKREQEGIE